MKARDKKLRGPEVMRAITDSTAYAAKRTELSLVRAPIVEQNRADAQPVVAALQAAGFSVTHIADLYNRRDLKAERDSAVPLLMRWLPRVTNVAVKDDMIRALSVKAAKPAAAPLMLKELVNTKGANDEDVCFAAANALIHVADDSYFIDIAQLLESKALSLGVRGRLAIALTAMVANRDAAICLLRRLLMDDDVAASAVVALGKLRAVEARHEIEPFAQHEEAWIRAEARKALSRINGKS